MNSANKPYALLGSGRLTSSLWKTINGDGDGQYRFDLFPIHRETGTVDQWLAPDDIESLVKVARVLAFELAEDGCMDRILRDRLYQLAEQRNRKCGPAWNCVRLAVADRRRLRVSDDLC